MIRLKKIAYMTFFLAFLSVFQFSFAQTMSAQDLQNKVKDIAATKSQLEAEIASYESQLKDIGAQKNTLQNAVAQLDITIKKNEADLKLTQNTIDDTTLQIQDLSVSIDKNTALIGEDQKSIGDLIVRESQIGSRNLIENFLAYATLSEFWNQEKNLSDIQNRLREKIDETRVLKQNLEDNKTLAENKKEQLINLKSELTDRKNVLAISRQDKAKLLADTKNKESNYQKILADKKAQSAALDTELVQYESQLSATIDFSKLPPIGSGILSWPLDVIRITQTFGVTDFSKTTNAYNGQGHNGVDFGAPIGTPVKAAADGSVLGIGNTDTVCPGASYGKWILIEHNNGLSTLYAHLSLIKVAPGDYVNTGDVIGYTGITGFTTGPHLHLTVYASQGVKITTMKSKVCNGTYTLPVAPLQAYLDPLQYL